MNSMPWKMWCTTVVSVVALLGVSVGTATASPMGRVTAARPTPVTPLARPLTPAPRVTVAGTWATSPGGAAEAPAAAAHSTSHPTVTITGRPADYRPRSVTAPQIAYGSPCYSGNYSFFLTNGTRHYEDVTVDGQFLIELPPYAATVVCGTNPDGASFTAYFGLLGDPGASLRATFAGVVVARPTVQITGTTPKFSPSTVNAPQIAYDSPCYAGNYSFRLVNQTTNWQTVTFEGQGLVTLPPMQATVVCGANYGDFPFSVQLGLTSNPNAVLTANFS
jgi:hypothetical protein